MLLPERVDAKICCRTDGYDRDNRDDDAADKGCIQENNESGCNASVAKRMHAGCRGLARNDRFDRERDPVGADDIEGTKKGRGD
jgi:hypothetical protein